MAQSDNHDYNVPAQGEEDWHEPLNENFAAFDTDIEVRDSDDDKGNYEPKQGAKFLATDTGVVYEGDGTEWVPTLTLSRYASPETDGFAGNLVAGHSSNDVSDGVSGATIAGGGFDDGNDEWENWVTGNGGTVGGGSDNRGGSYATVGGGITNNALSAWSTIAGGVENRALNRGTTIGGGRNNTARGHQATVGGGWQNRTEADQSTIGGGEGNLVEGEHATVAGGHDNEASAEYATAGGGRFSFAEGRCATVPGGLGNKARGDYSFAAGRVAIAQDDGAVVFGDSSSNLIQSLGTDEFRCQMPMYAPSFNTTSARAAKTNVEPFDPSAALEGVESLDVCSWEFTDTDDGRHVGPMAEDFHAAFDVGSDEGSIPTVDADGVAFAAIQGLSERHAEREERIDELSATVESQQEAIESLRAELSDLRGEQ